MENIQDLRNMKDSTPPPRPKDWSELTDSEKIERMREIIKNLSREGVQANHSIHSLRMKLKRHAHQDGKVVEIKEVQDYDDSGGSLDQATLSTQNFF